MTTATVKPARTRHETFVPVVPLLIAGALASGFVVWVALTSGRYSDFVLPYDSTRALREGRDLYFSPGTYAGWRNMNPPQLVVLMAPLAWLPVREALIVWWLVTALAIAGCIRLWARVLPPGWAVAVFALLFASAAGYLNVRYANQSWVAAFAVTWAWVAWRGNRDWRGAAVLGMVASIKLFVLILLPYFCWRRRWSAVAAFMTGVVAAMAVGLAVCGPSAYVSWLAALKEQTWQGHPLSMSILGGIARAFDEQYNNLAPVRVVPWLIVPLWIVGSAVLAGATWFRLRLEEHPDRDFAALLTLMLLLTPAGWVYYIPLAAGPLAAAAAASRRSWLQIGGVVALLMPYPFLSLGQPSVPHTLTLASSYMWGGLLLLAATLQRRDALWLSRNSQTRVCAGTVTLQPDIC